MSDVILMCGTSASAVGGDVVWVEPNWERRVENNRAASFYFEIDHLALAPVGSEHLTFS